MSAILKCFRTRHVFYAEAIDGDRLIGTAQLKQVSPTVEFETSFDDFYVPLDYFDGLECIGAGDLPGYVAVTFFKIIGGQKRWVRSYLYGPSGYLGEFATPAEALHTARAYRDQPSSAYGR